jgi:hypothetical protein
MVFSGLASKPVVTVFSSLASKLVAMIFSSLALTPVVIVSPGLASKLVAQVFRFGDLDLKTGSYDLVIWTSKSLRRFLGLGRKTKRALVYRLRHKTNEGRTARDRCQDLVTWFA